MINLLLRVHDKEVLLHGFKPARPGRRIGILLRHLINAFESPSERHLRSLLLLRFESFRPRSRLGLPRHPINALYSFNRFVSIAIITDGLARFRLATVVVVVAFMVSGERR